MRMCFGTPGLAALVIAAACETPTEFPFPEPNAAFASNHLIFDCAAQASIRQIECEALVALYHDTNGNNWLRNDGWLTAPDPCDWFGIVCSNSSVRIVDFRSNQLSGSLPPQLGDLTNLETLFLFKSRISGPIPAEFGKLVNLRFMDLSGNQLSGSIPPELGDLANLVFLILGVNDLSGSIPPELGMLASLVALGLGDNQLSGHIPPELGGLGELQFLDLSANVLIGQVPLTVAQIGGALIDPSSQICRLQDNLGLFMPDTQPYQDADLNGDGFICMIALGVDTDEDGIPDASDPDVLATVLETFPEAAFKSGAHGHRTAMQSILADAEAAIAGGDLQAAIMKLWNLRRHVDGCGSAADNDDWIVDCAAQIDVRDLIDSLIANLGG